MNKIKIDGKKIFINNEENILYGGEFQYFRIPRILWENSIKLIKEANCNFISFYIPWIWHEYEENIFDFEGKTYPERDLISFIKLCENIEINLMVRPGPYIYAEYQGFGVPEWLREKHPEILIKYENGKSSHEISLNHPTYLDYVKKWYKAVFKILKPYFDSDLIFACQIDNETGLPQFGYTPYMSDFNEDTVKKYRIYCENKFKTIENFNLMLKTNYSSFDTIEPPKKVKSNKYHFRFYGEFIEDYIIQYLQNLKNIIISLDIKTFFYLNDPYLCQWPHHSTKKTQVAPIGYDTYPKFSFSESILDLPFCLSYAPELFNSINSNSITIGAEIGCGWFDPHIKVHEESTLQLSLVSIARNTKLIAYYMLHDGLEYYNQEWVFKAPIDLNGKTTPRYDVIKSIGNFVKNYGNKLSKSNELYSPIIIGVYIPHARDIVRPNINYLSVLNEMNNALIHFNGASSIIGMLTEAGYNPKVYDLELLNNEILKKTKVLFIFSTGHIDKYSYTKILRFVYEGGTLITIGNPIYEDDLGEKLENSNLYPSIPDSPDIIHFGSTKIISKVGIDVINYQIRRRRIEHKHSLNTLDMMQPFSESIKYIGKDGDWADTFLGEKIWLSRFASFWKSNNKITPIIKYNDKIVSYYTQYGYGKSIFIGSLLGLFYDSSAFYTKDIKKKKSLTNFISYLLKQNGINKLYKEQNDIEIIIRNLENEKIIFCVNRGKRKDFKIETDFNFYQNIELIYKYKDSYFDLDYFKKYLLIKGVIDENDVMIFLLGD
jgi:beta-galactosidase